MFEEVPAALAEARRRGWNLVALTNSDRDLIDSSVRALGVPFEAAIVASEIGSYKPAHVHVARSHFHDIVPANELGIQWCGSTVSARGRVSGETVRRGNRDDCRSRRGGISGDDGWVALSAHASEVEGNLPYALWSDAVDAHLQADQLRLRFNSTDAATIRIVTRQRTARGALAAPVVTIVLDPET